MTRKMGMSDKIEAFILELMKQEHEEWLRIQRNELAQIFGCVPSQINYVISTRFNPEKGYAVESRRGGGGWVKIKKLPQMNRTRYTESEINQDEAYGYIGNLYETGKIDNINAAIIKAALSDNALASAVNRDKVRADILNCILETVMTR